MPAHAVDVRDVGHQRHDLEVEVEGLDELAVDLEEVVLRALREQEPRRSRNAATWRQISEPIEPPAPVTSTTRPSRSSAMRPVVEGSTGARRKQVLDGHGADPR